jgi:hypothetical protein
MANTLKAVAGAVLLPAMRKGAEAKLAKAHVPASCKYDAATGAMTIVLYPFQNAAEVSSTGKSFNVANEQGIIPTIETPDGFPAGAGRSYKWQVNVTVPLPKDDPIRTRMMLQVAANAKTATATR